jgi:hypothetical protein
VTVIMPVHNGARFIRQALDSLRVQTFADFHVLVVDDGSTDETTALIGGAGDSRIHLLQNPQRRGPAAARNYALDRVQSPLVAFLDSDDIAEPRRLELQMEWLRNRPGVGLVAAQARLIDVEGRATGAVWGFEQADELIAPSLLFRNRLPTSTILARRSAIGQLRFDDTLTVASDYEMWGRVLDRTEASIHPQPLVQYRVHPANITHQRADVAEQCLSSITRQRLARLDIAPSSAELALQRRIASGRLEGTLEFLQHSAAWLARLEAANHATRAYAARPFTRVLETEWLGICDAVARGGCWEAWPVMARTPLTRTLLRDRTGRRGLAPLPWRTVRGYVRRRWPMVGAALRQAISRT